MNRCVLFFRIFVLFFALYACQGAQELPNKFTIKSARYYWSSEKAIDTITFQLEISNISDTLKNYQYYKEDEFTKQRRILIDIDARKDSIFLLKVGDYSPNITRVVKERKKFYAGSKEIEVLKLKREIGGEGLNDVIFMTKEFGIVNMQSYDRRAKVLYSIASDKVSASILNEINTFLENDKTGFYYPLGAKSEEKQ
jgi:hypothetical protein